MITFCKLSFVEINIYELEFLTTKSRKSEKIVSKLLFMGSCLTDLSEFGANIDARENISVSI